MLGSPPVDPRMGHSRQKAVLAKLMSQFDRDRRRRGLVGRLGGGGSPGLGGRLTKFQRRGAVPRIARPFFAGREVGGFASGGLGFGRELSLGVQGAPGEFESSSDWGMEARDYPSSSLLPTPVDPIAGDQTSAPSAGLGTYGTAPAGDPYAPAQADTQTQSQNFLQTYGPSPTGQYVDHGPVSPWIPLGNGLYYNSETQIIRGMGTPAKTNAHLIS
jgi:hypothetical protein